MDQYSYLLSLEAVRDRARIVLQSARDGKLNHFMFHPERMSLVKDFVVDIISRDFGPDRYSEIPPHGRWQHFNVGGIDRIETLLSNWHHGSCEKEEKARRLIDLFFVSVLLDAGAGDVWKFKEPSTGQSITRSEGIAVASLYMFTDGAFSSNEEEKERVDASKLMSLDEETLKKYFQISSENPMVGISSRVDLLKSVGASLARLPHVFGPSGRPGNIVDYVRSTSTETQILDYKVLWLVLQQVLIPAWPDNRPRIQNKPIGDAWPLQVLDHRSGENSTSADSDIIQPFHKLTQWLGYSLTVPFTRVLDYGLINMNLGTGLPEYRNGGLFVDLGVLQLKPEVMQQGREASGEGLPKFPATGDVIVEWRSMTVALLDELHKLVEKHFEEIGVQLNMAQMLEAGTWKGGREIAAKYRPSTRSSPILIDGDGTLF